VEVEGIEGVGWVVMRLLRPVETCGKFRIPTREGGVWGTRALAPEIRGTLGGL